MTKYKVRYLQDEVIDVIDAPSAREALHRVFNPKFFDAVEITDEEFETYANEIIEQRGIK